ncbi:MAG: hypothetical protein ACREQ5_03415 [Candidatus Dormibacteria bacterium]
MATTLKPLFANSANITCTIGGLAASATVGRSSAAIDNTSNLYDDALVTVQIKTGTGAPGGDKAVYVFVYGSEDGTNYEQEESNSPASDAGYTINSPTIFKQAASLPVLTAAKTYLKVFTVAKFFGGVLPRKWGIIVVNNAGQALDATEGNHLKQYTGINWQQV